MNYYNYWNKFVTEWQSIPEEQFLNTKLASVKTYIRGWKNPNLEPALLNDPNNHKDYTIKYLPEPWWGNNGEDDLHSVVINYNPGTGGCGQHYVDASKLYGFNDYQNFVNSELHSKNKILKSTNDWHYNKRGKRVFETLEMVTGEDLDGNKQIANHLSIELIPWHTKDISNIQNYIDENLEAIFKYSRAFAANESSRIKNQKLKNKVIVRTSGTKTKTLLKKLGNLGFDHTVIVQEESTPDSIGANGKYLKFVFNDLSGVEFISIWGTKSHNDFPSDKQMEWIFKNVI